MHFIIFVARLSLILVSCLLIGNEAITGKIANITNVVCYINENDEVNLNVLINLLDRNETSRDFLDILKLDRVPKVIFHRTAKVKEITPIYKSFNSEMLSIVWFSSNQLNFTINLLDRLLWRRHFKNLLLIHQPENAESAELNHKYLHNIFQECWSKGFISVLLWSHHQLFTYHPYPSIKVVRLNGMSQFMDKSHLNNFHQRKCLLPYIYFPNQCFFYTNRQGRLIRTGYFYKWVELYLQYYNASIEHILYDMKSCDVCQKDTLKDLSERGYCLIPIFVRKEGDLFDISNVLYLSKQMLMVPNAIEIHRSLYLILPLSGFIWSVIVASVVMIFIVMYLLQHPSKTIALSKLALQAFSVILFLESGLEARKTLKYFLLHLLFLFIGIMTTNYYSSGLSSLFTTPLYEPPLKYLTDIGRTDLALWLYSSDVNLTLNVDIPKVLKERIFWGNNTELYLNRHKFNMSYIYKVSEELMDYLLFQQYYLKHPIAKKLEQELFYRGVYVTVPHRSPLIDHFNNYLMRIMENGLVQKFLVDAMWDGVLSGDITIILHSEEEKPLTLEYLQYAFVIWICGLLCALVAFLVENKIFILKRRRRTSCN